MNDTTIKTSLADAVAAKEIRWDPQNRLQEVAVCPRVYCAPWSGGDYFRDNRAVVIGRLPEYDTPVIFCPDAAADRAVEQPREFEDRWLRGFGSLSIPDLPEGFKPRVTGYALHKTVMLMRFGWAVPVHAGVTDPKKRKKVDPADTVPRPFFSSGGWELYPVRGYDYAGGTPETRDMAMTEARYNGAAILIPSSVATGAELVDFLSTPARVDKAVVDALLDAMCGDHDLAKVRGEASNLSVGSMKHDRLTLWYVAENANTRNGAEYTRQMILATLAGWGWADPCQDDRKRPFTGSAGDPLREAWAGLHGPLRELIQGK